MFIIKSICTYLFLIASKRSPAYMHRDGVGECGVYTFEVAETKAAIVHARARREGYPLRCSTEEV